MIRVGIVDLTAESRAQIAESFTSFLQSERVQSHWLPQINVHPISLHQLPFHDIPDICLLGPELCEGEISEIKKIRTIIPQATILALLSPGVDALQKYESLVSQGVDDVIAFERASDQIFKAILNFERSRKKNNEGECILVDSGKGGVGTTTIVAALGEQLLLEDKRVAVIDLDFVTQDLTRFLRVKPHTNEALEMLLHGARPLIQEFVAQCMTQVWEGEDRFLCVSPVVHMQEDVLLGGKDLQLFHRIIRLIRGMVDAVVIDLAGWPGEFARSFYRVASKIIYVTSNDPAGFHASIERLRQLYVSVAAETEIILLQNQVALGGLPEEFMRDQLIRFSPIPEEKFSIIYVPLCKGARRWAGSGCSPLGCGSLQFQSAIARLTGDENEEETERFMTQRASTVIKRVQKLIQDVNRNWRGVESSRQKQALLPAPISNEN